MILEDSCAIMGAWVFPKRKHMGKMMGRVKVILVACRREHDGQKGEDNEETGTAV